MQRHVQASFFGGFGSGLLHLTHANQILLAHLANPLFKSFLAFNGKDNAMLFGGFARFYSETEQNGRAGDGAQGPPYAERVSPTMRTGDQEKTNGSVRAPCSIATDACWHKAGGSFGLAPRFAKRLAGGFPFQERGRKKARNAQIASCR